MPFNRWVRKGQDPLDQTDCEKGRRAEVKLTFPQTVFKKKKKKTTIKEVTPGLEVTLFV